MKILRICVRRVFVVEKTDERKQGEGEKLSV